MPIPTDKKPVAFPPKPQQRRVVSSSLSSNYIRFHKGQLLAVALTLAIVGAGTAALGWALTR